MPSIRELGGAGWAAGGLEVNCCLAERAALGVLHASGLGPKTVDLPNQHEDDQGDDQKIDGGVDEQAVIEGGGACLPCRSQGGISLVPQADKQVAEIDLAGDQPERRHDDVRDQRIYDLAEGSPDNDS
jgi:hypothetical protein